MRREDKLLAEFETYPEGGQVTQVYLIDEDDTLFIGYAHATILNEPPYWDDWFWEGDDDGPSPPLRYDWSNMWTCPESGASLSVKQFLAIADKLRETIGD